MEHFLIDLKEYKDGKFVGHVKIGTDSKYIDDKNVYLSHLYVVKAYRHKGEGIKLMNRAIDTCKKLSIPRVYLWCIPKLIPFYKAFGAEDMHQSMLGYNLMMINIK